MSLSPYDMSLTTQDVERLRTARSVVIRQHQGLASITCRGSLATGDGVLSRIALRTREHEIPVHAGVEPYPNRRRWRRQRPLEFPIDATRLDPAWAEAVRALAPGHQVALAWNHDQAGGRLNADAVQLTVTAPYGAHASFTLAAAPEWDRATPPRRRRSRRRIRPVRAAMALLVLWLVASHSMLVAALGAGAVLTCLALARVLRGDGGSGRVRLWMLSVVGALLTWLPVLGVGVLCLWLLVRYRRTIRRVVRSRFGRRRAPGRGGLPVPTWATADEFAAPPPSGNPGGTNGSASDFHAPFASAGPRVSESDRAVLEHFAKHVGNVAVMLDALAMPGWQYRVDPQRLDPTEPADHLLTAAFNGEYDAGLDALMDLCVREGYPEFRQCVRASLWNEPCPELPQTADDVHNRLLTHFWTQAVHQRRDVRQPA